MLDLRPGTIEPESKRRHHGNYFLERVAGFFSGPSFGLGCQTARLVRVGRHGPRWPVLLDKDDPNDASNCPAGISALHHSTTPPPRVFRLARSIYPRGLPSNGTMVAHGRQH